MLRRILRIRSFRILCLVAACKPPACVDCHMPSLERAAALAPGNTRFQYVWAVALHDTGRPEQAISVLEKAHADRPADGDVLFTLAIYSQELGDREGAAVYAERLQALQPHNPQAAALIKELRGP